MSHVVAISEHYEIPLPRLRFAIVYYREKSAVGEVLKKRAWEFRNGHRFQIATSRGKKDGRMVTRSQIQYLKTVLVERLGFLEIGSLVINEAKLSC